MALGLTELGRKKRFDQLPGHRGAQRPSTDANDVHVVVLDSLPGREVVVDQGGADAPGPMYTVMR